MRDQLQGALAQTEQARTARVAKAREALVGLFGHRLRPEFGATVETLATLLIATLHALIVMARSTPERAAHRVQASPFEAAGKAEVPGGHRPGQHRDGLPGAGSGDPRQVSRHGHGCQQGTASHLISRRGRIFGRAAGCTSSARYSVRAADGSVRQTMVGSAYCTDAWRLDVHPAKTATRRR